MARGKLRTQIRHSSRDRGHVDRALGVEVLETRTLLAAFPLPLVPVEPVGSMAHTGSVADVHGVEGPAEDFESGELGSHWSTSSSDAAGRIQLRGDSGTAGGSYALIMGLDRFAGAQDLDAASWSRSADPNIANSQTRPHITVRGTGDGTFDFYRFTVQNAGDVGVFDIDSTASLDSYLRLYNASGTEIARNDDSNTSSGAGGSQSGLDSYLEFTFPAEGEYVIEVGSCCSPNPVQPGARYTLHVSLDNHAFEEGAGRINEVEPNQVEGSFNLNEAVWTVDLSGTTDALLQFSHASFGDSPDAFDGPFEGSFNADGIAISGDGTTWHPIFTPPFAFGDWQEYVIDLGGEAAAAGLELGEDFQIKFQQFGDGSSRGWDDISLLLAGDETDSYEIGIEPGHLLTLAITPLVGSLQPSVEVFAVSGEVAELQASVTATGPGQTAIVQTLATTPGVEAYRIDIHGARGVGTYDVRLAVNAALEEEAHGGADNSTRDAAQDLDPAWTAFGPDLPAAPLARAAVLGSLGPGPAAIDDFYSVHLEAGETVTAMLNTLGGGSADLALLGPDGSPLAMGSSGSATNIEVAIADFVAPASGTYYLQVTGDEFTGYSLLVVRNAGFERESNSTLDQAYAVTGPEPGRGRWLLGARDTASDFPPVAETEPNHPTAFGHVDAAQNIDESGWTRAFDENIVDSETRPHVTIQGSGNNTFDYFAFTVANAGDVGIFDIDSTSSLDSYLRLYDADGIELARNDDSSTSSGAGGSETSLDSYLEFTFPEPGEYVIEVGSCCSPNPVNSGTRYTLHVSLDNHPLSYDIRPIRDREPNEPAEPDLVAIAQDIDDEQWTLAHNDDIDRSTSIPYISIAGTGDGTFDYYSFTIDRTSAFGVFDIDYENFNTQLFLFDEEGNLLAENNDGGDDPGSGSTFASYLSHRFTSPGTYVIGVARFFSSAEGGQISGTPPQPGDVYTLHVSLRDRSGVPAGDYYAVELNGDTSILVETFTPSVFPDEFANGLDPLVRVYDASGNLVASDDNSAADGRNAALIFHVPSDGTYYIDVTSASSSGQGEYVLGIREASLEGDYDGSGLVDQSDLDLVLMHWGQEPEQLPPQWVSDLPSGVIDQEELDAVLVNWSHTAEQMVAGAAPARPVRLTQLDSDCRALPQVPDQPSAAKLAVTPPLTAPPQPLSQLERKSPLSGKAPAAEIPPPQPPLVSTPVILRTATSGSELGLVSAAASPRLRDLAVELLFGTAERLI